MAERGGAARLAVLVAAVVLLGRPAGAQDPAVTIDGEPCSDATGVTVVIDFQELGDDTVLIRCAPDAPQDGFEALEQAGIPYRTTVAFPGFLCRIADRPDDDPCDTASPADAYWSYWLAPAGGEWCYSNKGAGNRTPPAGAVEGWSFALDRTTDDVPPPRHAPPGSPDDAVPLATDDCTTAATSSGPDPAGTAPEAEAVGRGTPVDLADAGGGDAPVGTVVGIVAMAVVAATAIALARRRRRRATAITPEPATDDPDRWRPPADRSGSGGWSEALRPRPEAPQTDEHSIWARPSADGERGS